MTLKDGDKVRVLLNDRWFNLCYNKQYGSFVDSCGRVYCTPEGCQYWKKIEPKSKKGNVK